MQQNPVRFAIVGAGHIGKRHAEMIQRNSDCRLTAFCDTKPESELELNRFEVPFYSSLHELFESGPEFDVLSVASPNGCHAEHAVAGLEKGKHVLIEKPMALSKAECERIIRTSEMAGKQVFCVMQNRYSPPSVWIKDILNRGILGQIYMVQINCYWNRDHRYYRAGNWKGRIEQDGGTLFTQFSHFIDMMYWLFGDIENIQARFRDFNHGNLTDFEDSGLVQFDFKRGGVGCLNYSSSVWDKNFESSISILAENGTVKIGGQYMNQVEYCHIKDYSMPELPPANPANDYGPYKGSAANHNYVYENVIDSLRNKNSVITNAAEGLKVVEIIERIYSQNLLLNKSR